MASGSWDKTAAIICGIRSALGDKDADLEAYHPYKAADHNRRNLRRYINQQKGQK